MKRLPSRGPPKATSERGEKPAAKGWRTYFLTVYGGRIARDFWTTARLDQYRAPVHRLRRSALRA